MTNAKTSILKELLAANGGIVQTQILNKNGFNKCDVKLLVQDGFLERVKLGHYIEKQRAISDIGIITKLVPMGVLCLFSAIDHYGLATVNPSKICLALPRGATCPVLPPNLFIRIYHMTDSHFEAGIINVEIDGVMVRMYDAEKTVCDCFKYDNVIEKGIALEVLRNYITGGKCNIQKLMEYAKLLGKKKIIYPYVEALI